MTNLKCKCRSFGGKKDKPENIILTPKKKDFYRPRATMNSWTRRQPSQLDLGLGFATYACHFLKFLDSKLPLGYVLPIERR